MINNLQEKKGWFSFEIKKFITSSILHRTRRTSIKRELE